MGGVAAHFPKYSSFFQRTNCRVLLSNVIYEIIVILILSLFRSNEGPRYHCKN